MKALAVGADKFIAPLHEALGALQNAKAAVLMNHAGSHDGLLAYHTFTGHLLIASDWVVDQPVPPDQLNGVVSDIFDPDPVSEDIAGSPRV